MAAKLKVSKKSNYAKQDREDNRKFLIVLAISTIALLLLLSYIFVFRD